MTELLTEPQIVQHLIMMVLKEQTAEYGERIPMARERSKWIEDNVPTYLHAGIWKKVFDATREAKK
jgi:hypothetical protein